MVIEKNIAKETIDDFYNTFHRYDENERYNISDDLDYLVAATEYGEVEFIDNVIHILLRDPISLLNGKPLDTIKITQATLNGLREMSKVKEDEIDALRKIILASNKDIKNIDVDRLSQRDLGTLGEAYLLFNRYNKKNMDEIIKKK